MEGGKQSVWLFLTHSVYTLFALNQEFEIPPNAANHEVQASLALRRLPRGGELLAITPHMHFRGKSFSLHGNHRSHEGEAQTLLSVPNYDFNWQHTYINANPLKLDSVKALRFEAAFDNSDANPFNPDPKQTVTWGDQTWEEMAVAFFEVAVPNRKLGEEAFRRLASDSTAKSTSQTRAQKIEAYVSRVMEKMDRNGDGQVKKAEAPMVVRRWSFWRWDQNNDQIATEDEIRAVAESLF